MFKVFDLIIVGAGPAGSSAAFTAAQLGVSVLLLEEHPKVGLPLACAEGLSRSAIKDYLEIRSEWIAQSLTGAIIRGPDNAEFKIEYPNVGWILNREVFDPALAQIAKDFGCVVKTSAKALGIEDDEVVVDESGARQRYKFKFLIGADGIASNVGRWFGLDTRLSLTEIDVCAEYLIEGINIDARYCTFIIGGDCVPGCYAWIFPKSDKSANVGLAISPVRTKKCAKFYLDQWVNREFATGTIKKKIFGGVPVKILKKFSGPNFCLIGDAARLTDPLNGAGIANGVKSGIIAGRNVVLRLKGKKDYFEAEIKKEILAEIKFHLKVRNAYLKLTKRDYQKIFGIGKRIFSGHQTENINMRHLVKEILFSAPRLLKIGFSLLF